MKTNRSYKLVAKVWLYPGQGGWHFMSLPKQQSSQIKLGVDEKTAWGSIRVRASIGDVSWETSLFPDKKTGVYLLPLKAEIRKKAEIQAGDQVTVILDLPAP